MKARDSKKASISRSVSSVTRSPRRLRTVVILGQPEILGRDVYTLLTESQEREECLRDLGDIPSPTAGAVLLVEAYRNVAGMSAVEWVRAPRNPGGYVLSTHRKVEPLTVGGREAVRLVADNATADVQALVIRADDRMYVLTPSLWPSQHDLERIAGTFGTVARQPFPTATPTPAPAALRQAAGQLATSLARAFAERDANAIARLMPDCHIGVGVVIDGGGLANSGGGGLSRSVEAFIQALRARFAAGDLIVTIDPTLQTDGNVEGSYYVRSEWKEPDRTTPIDLFLSERDGRWLWTGARHHYTRAQVGTPPCIPYRSPWVTPTRPC